jgi:hypothetical protein
MKNKLILLVLFTFIIFGCKSKLKTRELGAYSYKTAAVNSIDGKVLVTSFGQGKTKEECLRNAMITALNDVIFKGVFAGNPNFKQVAILGKPSDFSTYSEFFNSFTSPSGKYLDYIQLYNQPRSQSHSKKIRKLDRVLNMTLEYQLLVDRNGLVNLFKQTDLIKNQQYEK